MSDREREVKLLAVSREQLDSQSRRPGFGGLKLLPAGESRCALLLALPAHGRASRAAARQTQQIAGRSLQAPTSIQSPVAGNGPTHYAARSLPWVAPTCS